MRAKDLAFRIVSGMVEAMLKWGAFYKGGGDMYKSMPPVDGRGKEEKGEQQLNRERGLLYTAARDIDRSSNLLFD